MPFHFSVRGMSVNAFGVEKAVVNVVNPHAWNVCLLTAYIKLVQGHCRQRHSTQIITSAFVGSALANTFFAQATHPPLHFRVHKFASIHVFAPALVSPMIAH